MQKMKAAWIGFLEKGEKFWEDAEILAQLGYCATESAERALSENNVSENIARFHALGLRLLTVSADRNKLTDEALAALIARAHALHTDRATIWCGEINSMFWDVPPQYDAYMRELETYETAAAKLAKEGIRLTYHNHFQEFTEIFKGVQAYNYMLSNTEQLCFELDVAWATYGGMDPVAVMRRMGTRLIALHIKDYLPPEKLENPQHPNIVFTGLGTGVVNLSGVLQCAAEMQIPYAVVEQDTLRHLSAMDTLRLGYYFMKETGFVA